jgi:Plasmid pRiA4b ORF-3-like protein
MAKKKTSTHDETDSVKSGNLAFQPSPSLARESLALNLSEGQHQTILKYAELPAHLSERFAVKGTAAKATPFTLDELDELLDHVEVAVYRAKGNEKQKVLRIVEKVTKLLGSTIDPDEKPTSRLAKKTDTVFQIKMTLKGIDPPIWRRIQTKDCTLDELHALIQVTMGWEFEHLYRFNIGGVDYSDLDMMNDEDIEDACGTTLSEVLPPRNRRPRFQYEYDFGDSWIHQLIVEERFPPDKGVKYPLCVAGQRACPPEDCGGPWAYPDFVETISNPDHQRHEETLEWVGGEFDPEKFDLKAVNSELLRMRTRKP